MAAPNIVGVTTITGSTDFLNVGIAASNVVANAASSGKVYKINTLIISNVTGQGGATGVSANVNVDISRGGGGTGPGTTYELVSTVVVPDDATLIVISKDTAIYLEEDDGIRVWSNAASQLVATCSYEEIS